jgi:hypothetical protein
MTNIDRRAKQLQGTFDNLDGTIDTSTKAARVR